MSGLAYSHDVSAQSSSAASGPGRSRRTRNRRGEGWRLREDLLNAADSLLDEVASPDTISLREVARRAGVSPMAPYRHFASSQELVGEVLTKRFAALAAALTEGVRLDDLIPERARAQLIVMAERYVEWGRTSSATYHGLFDSSRVPAEQMNMPGAELFDAVATLIGACSTHDDLDAQTAARLFWCGLHGIVSLPERGVLVGWTSDQDMIADLVRLTTSG